MSKRVRRIALFVVALGILVLALSQDSTIRSKFRSAVSDVPTAAEAAAANVCAQRVANGLYANCTVIGFVASNPETDSVYGQYLFRISRTDELGTGLAFVIVYMAGGEVFGVK